MDMSGSASSEIPKPTYLDLARENPPYRNRMPWVTQKAPSLWIKSVPGLWGRCFISQCAA
jgi:hypothetical protein